jgi:uncharacterized membrane protein
MGQNVLLCLRYFLLLSWPIYCVCLLHKFDNTIERFSLFLSVSLSFNRDHQGLKKLWTSFFFWFIWCSLKMIWLIESRRRRRRKKRVKLAFSLPSVFFSLSFKSKQICQIKFRFLSEYSLVRKKDLGFPTLPTILMWWRWAERIFERIATMTPITTTTITSQKKMRGKQKEKA